MCPGSKAEKSGTKNVQSRQCAWQRKGERFNPKMQFKRVGGVVGDLPHVSLPSKSLFGAQAVVASACVTKQKTRSGMQSRFFEVLLKEDRDMGGARG